ncbi:hypothetical protein [Virgibacillus oceani]|uniref:Uncharacterized protein n=1 Tax=Virgibacillus oceani TaxID=1479511 RepID=A0A917M7N7_9BACI|nr:hypothetical protein [Virgibacillus oceani]GGG84378.1 hypothetical protein GCM10011398_32530 [Virgibacillus oceani]
MHEFRSLKFLDLFQSLFRSIHIDYSVMRKILEMKLLMDQRRVPVIFSNDMSKKRKEGNQFLKSLGIYALYGLVLIPFLFIGDNYMFQMSIVFGIAMFILMTSLISDFSAVLLDVRDKAILNTKPVNARTINTAKVIHIMIYMSMLTGAFIGIPAIVMLFTQGILYFLVFLIDMVFLLLFIIAITALIYIFILRFFSGDRLKDIINYVQILLSVGIVVGYQIVIRVFDFDVFDIGYQFSYWHLLLPPAWFAAPFEFFINGNSAASIIVLALCAVIIPFLSISVYYRMMPAFERNLQKLLDSTAKTGRRKRLAEQVFEKLLCSSKEEKLFFRFSSAMMRQERDFKLKVYPSLGMAFIFPFIFLFNELNNGTFAELAASNAYFNIYFSCIMIGSVVYMLKFSENYKGGWIFYVAPIHNPSTMYEATLKAFIVKLYLPVYILLSVIFVSIFSVRILPDLVIVLVTVILFTLISYKLLNNDDFAFTKPIESMQMQGGNTAVLFILMALVGVFAAIHYFMSKMEYGVYIYLVVLSIATIIAWKFVWKRNNYRK